MNTEQESVFRNTYKAPFEVERPEKASMTLLSHVDRCPYSAALYLRHKHRPQTPAMARGELVHAAIERTINDAITAGEPDVPPDVAKDWAQALIEERVDLALPESEHDIIRIASWHWGWATVLDLESIVGVELMLELPIGNWTVRGKLDLCEIAGSQGIVTDWKTSLYVPTQEDYERDFQARFYALLLAEGCSEGETIPLGQGLEGFHTKQVFPRHDPQKNGGELVARSAYFDRQQLFDFKRGVEAHLAKLEHGLTTGEWAAQQGSHCAICPAAHECPIPSDLRDRSIATEGEALEVAAGIPGLERELKDAKAALKAWVDENGEVVVGNEKWTFTLTTTERVDKDGIKAFIEHHGADPTDFFKTSQSTRFGKKRIKEGKE